MDIKYILRLSKKINDRTYYCYNEDLINYLDRHKDEYDFCEFFFNSNGVLIKLI